MTQSYVKADNANKNDIHLRCCHVAKNGVDAQAVASGIAARRQGVLSIGSAGVGAPSTLTISGSALVMNNGGARAVIEVKANSKRNVTISSNIRTADNLTIVNRKITEISGYRCLVKA